MIDKEIIRESVGNYLRRNAFKSMNLKCALFDMDGVLFDSMPFHAQSWVKAMEKRNIAFNVDDAYKNEGRTGASTIELAMRNQGIAPLSDNEIKEIYADKCAIFNSLGEAAPMRGAYELVKDLKDRGIRMSIVTGSAQKTLLGRINSFYSGMFELENMVTAFDVKNGKPSPEPYLMGLKKMGVDANEAFIVENAPLGAKAGRAANVFTIVVNTGPLSDELLLDSGADLLFKDMNEFRMSLDNLFEVVEQYKA